MNFQATLVRAQGAGDDVDAYDDLARAALGEREEEAALPLLLDAAARWKNARLWQWTGLLQRSLDEHGDALDSFAMAAQLAPGDAGIAHGQARVAMEAGLDAVSSFERARALAPGDGAVLIGLAAARTAIGQGEWAAAELEAVLEQAPMWTAGHEQLAQLLATLGHVDRATDSLERALAANPRQEGLWASLFGIHLRRERYETLRSNVERAKAAGIPAAGLALYEAICAGELDDEVFPSALFGDAGVADQLGIWRIRHLLRVGAAAEALPIIDLELSSERAPAIWPYASLAWRLAGDERSRWLERDLQLVGVADIGADLPPLEKLADTLRSLHIAKGEYLDQSVRGGTQTDGPLLSRVDPVIRQLRSAIVRAVEAYVAELPPADPAHPHLGRRRDRRIRFSGSWSVRLRSGGRHSAHVHPQGWISSALYIAVPAKKASEHEDAGWFTLGGPHEHLGLNLPPLRRIEPKPGRLVLFPSWMWHGTVPFAEGERLTVAFDVRPPI